MKVPVVYIDESDEDVLEAAITARSQVLEARVHAWEAKKRRYRECARQERLAQRRQRTERVQRKALRQKSTTSAKVGTAAENAIVIDSDGVADQPTSSTKPALDDTTKSSETTSTSSTSTRLQPTPVVATATPTPPLPQATESSMAHEKATRDPPAQSAIVPAMNEKSRIYLRDLLGMHGEKMSDGSGRIFWRVPGETLDKPQPEHTKNTHPKSAPRFPEVRARTLTVADTNTEPAKRANDKISLRDVLGMHGEKFADASGRVFWEGQREQRTATRSKRSMKARRSPKAAYLAIVADNHGGSTNGWPKETLRFLQPTEWPTDVVKVGGYRNPDGIRFASDPPFLRCECATPCRIDTCANGRNNTFCDTNCCPYNGSCGNGVREMASLRLATKHDGDKTVITVSNIAKGVVIGEYFGRLQVVQDQPPTHVVNNGYHYKLATKASRPHRARVIIDAKDFGWMTRFINHSCNPSADFYEMANGPHVTVVVATKRRVWSWEEITVDYGDRLWFVCRCGEPGCCHRDIHAETARKSRLKTAFIGVLQDTLSTDMFDAIDLTVYRKVFAFAGLARFGII